MEYISLIISLLISITVHECSHAYFAYVMGDPTAKLQGRVSLNPKRHLDPLGTIMIFITFMTGFGIGWGKPVPVNPYNFKNPKIGEAITAIAGPMANFVLALFASFIIRFFSDGLSAYISQFLMIFVFLNLGLMCFNLIPLPPLDGSKILFLILPDKYYSYRPTLERNGPIIFLGIILLSQFLNIPVLEWVIMPMMKGALFIIGLS